MSVYSIYLKATGQFKYSIASNMDQSGLENAERGVLEGRYNGETQYVVNRKVVARPPMGLSLDKPVISADAVDVVTVSGVPVGTLLRVNGRKEGVVTDGTVEFSTDIPGQYRLRFQLFPYLTEEIVVDAGP